MKLKLSLTLLTFSFSLSAYDLKETGEDISSLLESYDKSTLTEISNELIKMASKEENIGEFDLASVHYKRALKIRESIGLRSHKSYASILYLSSGAQFQAGQSCEASISAREASIEFAKHGLVKYQEKALIDHEAYGKVCSLVALN
ncbi:MAG: tetratricopeptide repeat protein [Leptospira sp.]|nr:tetratricopeptide repeat protein [Leptospira sp.]